MITKSDWQTIQHRLLEVDHDPLGEPPAVEEMLAYARGELATRDEERVRRLLVVYPELAHALTAPFPEDDAMPGDVDYLGEEEITRRWLELRSRIQGGGDRTNVVQFWRRATAAVAAALVLALGGLLGQAQWDAHRLRVEVNKPRAASESVLLYPVGQRGRPSGIPTLATNGESTLLVLPLVGPASFPEYRLDIAAEDGRVLWTSSALRIRDDDTFTILVPHAFLRSGKYRVTLYGIDGSREDLVEIYPLRVP
jgi:hypothetical protein